MRETSLTLSKYIQINKYMYKLLPFTVLSFLYHILQGRLPVKLLAHYRYLYSLGQRSVKYFKVYHPIRLTSHGLIYLRPL
jgi:hypothetical protein